MGNREHNNYREARYRHALLGACSAEDPDADAGDAMCKITHLTASQLALMELVVSFACHILLAILLKK